MQLTSSLDSGFHRNDVKGCFKSQEAVQTYYAVHSGRIGRKVLLLSRGAYVPLSIDPARYRLTHFVLRRMQTPAETAWNSSQENHGCVAFCYRALVCRGYACSKQVLFGADA